MSTQAAPQQVLNEQAIALKQRTGRDVAPICGNYITPDTVHIPGRKKLHMPIPLYKSKVENIPPEKAVQLDGFKLLEATGMGFPEDGRVAHLSDKKLTAVVEDDMSFFTGLLMLDVSENRLKLNYFWNMPRLKEIRLACNSIRSIENLYGFHKLQILDLSYNNLSLDSVRELYKLPNLRDLDLCGNDLSVLPADMYLFNSLERLLLEHNKIQDNYVFDILARMPALRDLTLAYNSLTEVPIRVCNEGNFRLLSSISLAFNFFGSDGSVEPALSLPRLSLLTLYGNPLLGPTGEDTSGIYVEDLYMVSEDIEQRLFPQRHLKIIASVPRKMGSINKLQPKNTYEDVKLVKVPTTFEPQLNREYRKTGTETLFAQAYKKAKLSNDEAISFPVSTTFLTTGYTGPEVAGVERIAGGVMDKVVESLGLNSATSLMDMQDAAASFMRLKDNNAEKIPTDLFGRKIESKDDFGTSNAIRALKYALNHPLTNDRVVVPQNYSRQTASTLKAQMPRCVPLTKSSTLPDDFNSPSKPRRVNTLDEILQLPTDKNYNHGYSRGRTRRLRKQDDSHGNAPSTITLKQIDDILNGLNDGDVGGAILTGNDADVLGSSVNRTPDRKSMKRMNRGIRGLIKMVQATVEDINI